MRKEPRRCPYCDKPARLSVRTVRYRRGRRVLGVRTEHWECVSGCEAEAGAGPFRFQDRALARSNDEVASEAWQRKFGEPMPARGRAGRPTEGPRRVRVQVLFSEVERDRADRARGRVSRSAFLRQLVERSGSARAPGFPLRDRPDPRGPHREVA